MESIGRLAGGVAHDFNNMLSIILGYAESLLDRFDAGDPLRQDVQQIMDAGKRSAGLTRQLLAYARKQVISPRILDLNDTIEDMLKMLRRLIGENIRLIWLPGHRLPPVKMDPTQMDQILANLLVEDEAVLLEMCRTMLERLGYRVLTAGTPDQAIGLAREPSEAIQMLMTDVVMPQMNGQELARRLREMRPHLKCLFMSGYTSDIIAKRGVVEKGVHFIQKPFSVDELARKVREALESRE